MYRDYRGVLDVSATETAAQKISPTYHMGSLFWILYIYICILPIAGKLLGKLGNDHYLYIINVRKGYLPYFVNVYFVMNLQMIFMIIDPQPPGYEYIRPIYLSYELS